jgi:Fe-S cluster assembly protein SufB/Fe-S cluster assembly protein SufD
MPIFVPPGKDPVTIRAEAGKDMTFIDHDAHDIEVILEPGSTVTFVSLCNTQNASPARQLRSEVHEGARMHWLCVTRGDAQGTHNLTSKCRGRNAKSQIDWIFLTREEEKQKISVRNIFDAEGGEGEIALQGIAEGKSVVSCKGMIEITERGKGTDAFLRETTLMLDPTAKVDAVPGLEIRTNDVKASHAATVTRVSPDDLFYFSARGIEEEEARRMFIEGFFLSLTQRLPVELQSFVSDMLEK